MTLKASKRNNLPPDEAMGMRAAFARQPTYRPENVRPVLTATCSLCRKAYAGPFADHLKRCR